MHSLANFSQPLILWLQIHPYWALWITFLISFAESLAIIGSIIPGSVTMTAIGILAGTGAMRIDLTLLAATLGAIAGDGISYMLGYLFSDRLLSIWPFSRYPNLISYGKDYFSRHGGKSVLIGRFVGPLRSIIPVIAGMMHMNHWHFYIANIISAIGWSLLYVLPGILIGAASSELSPESASRLFLCILALLGGIWLVSIGIHWLVNRIKDLLRIQLHQLWTWLGKQPSSTGLFRLLTPVTETNHYSTAALVSLVLLSSLSFCLVSLLVIQNNYSLAVNKSCHFFLQSLRTLFFDWFFIVIDQIVSPITLVTLFVSILASSLYQRDWRTLGYWLSLTVFCLLICLLLPHLLYIQSPEGMLPLKYPILSLSLASALFSAFLLYVNAYCKPHLTTLIQILLLSGLFLAGLAKIYLGEHWLTYCVGSYLCGFSLSLIHWLFYRRFAPSEECKHFLPGLILVLMTVATLVSTYLNFQKAMRTHQPCFAQYIFTDDLWWKQTKPLMPIYSTDRIGRSFSLFNIQYAGSLTNLEEALYAFGWRRQNASFINLLMLRFSGKDSSKLPLTTPFYLNRKPILVMTYSPHPHSPLQILRIWRSNYHLQHFLQPIWLGSVHPYVNHKSATLTQSQDAFKYVRPALTEFTQRQYTLPISKNKQPTITIAPRLLLIKESSMEEKTHR